MLPFMMFRTEVSWNPEEYCWCQMHPFRRSVVAPKPSASGIHVNLFQSDMEGNDYSRMNVYVNVVQGSGTNVFLEVS